MVETGWALDELPAMKAARELAEAGEREAGRIERARLDEQRERLAEDADAAETRAWMARLRGQALPDVDEMLTRGREDTRSTRDDESQRRHQAREILRQYGLEDVLGGWSGTILDANMGVVEAPGRDVVQRSAMDFEDAEAARLVKRYAEDRAYIQSIARSRPPFARRSAAVRSESCQHCTDQGVDDETSYLLHSDPELNVPVTTPAEKAEADRRQAEAARLVAEGFTAETARYAAGLAAR